MKKAVAVLILACVGNLCAQEDNVVTVRDGFLSIATDARAAGQGDIGVATEADAFSQFWNPSKYVFSDKKFEIGVTQIFGNNQELNEFSQLSLTFYNKLDERSAYGLSIRSYANTTSRIGGFAPLQGAHEVALDGSYTLRLGDGFAMSVGARFISLKGKVPLSDNFAPSLYGIDVSGFYHGNEMAFKKFNGRFRAGFNFSNLRGKSTNDNTDIEIYAPSTLKVGMGFDFILDQDNLLGITSEYKTLLDSYVENDNGEKLAFGLEGDVAALGFEYTYREKIMARTGYSQGINRRTDSFGSIGAGIRSRYADVDIALLLGVSQEENLIREKVRVSLSLNLEEVFANEKLFPSDP